MMSFVLILLFYDLVELGKDYLIGYMIFEFVRKELCYIWILESEC